LNFIALAKKIDQKAPPQEDSKKNLGNFILNNK